MTPGRPPASIVDALGPAPEVAPSVAGGLRRAALDLTRGQWLRDRAQDPGVAQAAHHELELVLQDLRGHLQAIEDLAARIPDLQVLTSGLPPTDRRRLAQEGRLPLPVPRFGSREALVDLARWRAAQTARTGAQ